MPGPGATSTSYLHVEQGMEYFGTVVFTKSMFGVYSPGPGKSSTSQVAILLYGCCSNDCNAGATMNAWLVQHAFRCCNCTLGAMVQTNSWTGSGEFRRIYRSGDSTKRRRFRFCKLGSLMLKHCSRCFGPILFMDVGLEI